MNLATRERMVQAYISLILLDGAEARIISKRSSERLQLQVMVIWIPRTMVRIPLTRKKRAMKSF